MAKPPFLQLGIAAIVLFVTLNVTTCIEFHRETSGVVFSAYVKRSENGEIPWWKTYTLEDIKTMLKVISSKFTRVVTFGVGADNVPYEKGVTYNNSNAQVMSAEAAALLNHEIGEKNLTMIVGMWLSDLHQQTHTEVRLALESAEVANSIFEGTVEGFLFAQLDIQDNLFRANQILQEMRFMKNYTNLKLGTLQKCHGIVGDSTADELTMIRREIVKMSDFILCEVRPANQSVGPENGFVIVHSDLLRFRKELEGINPHIQVMGEVSWAYNGSKSWETLENMKEYWRVADAFGEEQNFTMIMNEAFDNPWNMWAPHDGWWRLKKNSLVGRAEGYAENISERPNEDDSIPTGSVVWVYVVLLIGVILIIAATLAAVGLLYIRASKYESLTSEDVNDFMYGLSAEAAAQQGGDVEMTALKSPYDKSYEIPREKLNIRKDLLLGSGKFGCVYKALIESKDEMPIEVALKMTKNNCPKAALVGLLSEIKILIHLGKHPNIVSIHGAYTGEILKGIVYVATELCPNGSLESYLRKYPFHGNDLGYSNMPQTTAIANCDNPDGTKIRLSDMIRWSHEIACGMEYLGVKGVVHADLATRNVLLAADKTAKITDFGLSHRLYDYTSYVKAQQEALPWRWMAIESLKRLEFSEKSDVWSYGVTLWEIFAMGDVPYPGLNWNLEFVDTLVSGLRMNSPPHATPEIYEIMVRCWNLDPKARPIFKDLKRVTAQLLESSTGRGQ